MDQRLKGELDRGIRAYQLLGTIIGKIYLDQYQRVSNALKQKSYLTLSQLLSDVPLNPVKQMNFQGEIVEEPSELVQQLNSYFSTGKRFTYSYAANQLTIDTRESRLNLYMGVLNIGVNRAQYLLSRDPSKNERSSYDTITMMALSLDLTEIERNTLNQWIQQNLYILQASVDIMYPWFNNLSRFINKDKDEDITVYINRSEGDFTRSLGIYLGVTSNVDVTELEYEVTRIMREHGSIGVVKIDMDDLTFTYTVKYYTPVTNFLVPWFFLLRPIWTIPVIMMKNHPEQYRARYNSLEQKIKQIGLEINYQNSVVSNYPGIIPGSQAYPVEITQGKFVFHLAKDQYGNWIKTVDQLLAAVNQIGRNEELLIKGISGLSLSVPNPTMLTAPVIKYGSITVKPAGNDITGTPVVIPLRNVLTTGITSPSVRPSDLSQGVVIPLKLTSVTTLPKPAGTIYGPITVNRN